MTLNNIIFFIGSTIFAAFLHTYLFNRAAKYKIKKANQTGDRWGSQSKPILGGITFYVMFLLSLVYYAAFFDYSQMVDKQALGAVIVLNLAFLMGLADDMINTPPGFKFLIQILCVVILILFDVYIKVYDYSIVNYAITTLWFVGIMNSINMLDNMDAITTSVGITVLIGVLVALLVLTGGHTVLFIVCLGVLAALIGFMKVNWNPAKMYMGDNGSQFLGALLAIVGIIVFWNGSTIGTEHKKLFPFFLVFLAFIIPITDTTTVTINRLMRGQSPFVGGRDHTTHHLSYLGLKERPIAALLMFINGLGVLTAVFLLLYPERVLLPLWLIGALFVIVSLLLYLNTKYSKPVK